MAKIYLKKNEDRRLLAGHQWVFSNEIKKIEDFVTNGEVSELFTENGRFLGKGFYNKNSLIAYRHITDKDEIIDKKFILKKINNANSLRKLYRESGNVYRIVNSESDFLPGLIIDKFGDRYSIQIFSLGMESYLEDIVNILKEYFKAKLIVEKNDNDLRKLEGLEKREGIIFSEMPSNEFIFTEEIDGIKFKFDLINGQKTGFYLDQRRSRKIVGKYIHDRHCVLDLFCNEGGFAITCVFEGANEITAVDSSEHSIKMAKENAALNSAERINFICSDVFEYLNGLFQSDKKYDVIILDPPSFTKSRKNLVSALKGYEELNTKCMRLLKTNSLLFTFSCSHHISEKTFEDVIVKSSLSSKRKIRILESINCSFDHPVIPQMNETKYLKGYLLNVK
ncbi:MAG: Ribosomal RNA large subunit methyltransferase I [Ignavibacteria bacterium]|nr:Ribosomal RNA large subunit methyltransferase I [Ignavibacteria bacterium]